MYSYDYGAAIQDVIESAGCNLAELVARANLNDMILKERLAWMALEKAPGVLTPIRTMW